MSDSPIFDAVQRDLAGQQAREFVRASFPHLVAKPVACPRCHAAADEPCMTASGLPAKARHVARGAA